MCLRGLVVAAVLTLISDQCNGNTTEIIMETGPSIQEASILEPSSTTYTQIFPRSLANAESTEEQQGYNTHFAPSTVNFQDIYSNTLALLAVDDPSVVGKDEDPLLVSMKDDDDFHLNNLNTQFVEFHPKTVPPSTIPPPLFLLNSSYIKTDDNSTMTNTTMMADDAEEMNIEVIPMIPIKKPLYQRGLLDLLFPAERVKTFKSVFDTFRRLMSHTFR